jgi:hypothetical protein
MRILGDDYLATKAQSVKEPNGAEPNGASHLWHEPNGASHLWEPNGASHLWHGSG